MKDDNVIAAHVSNQSEQPLPLYLGGLQLQDNKVQREICFKYHADFFSSTENNSMTVSMNKNIC